VNGFNSEEEMLAAVNDIAGKWYVDPGRRAEIHQLLIRNGTVSKLVSEVHRYKTRERIWIEESTRLVRDRRTGEPRYYDGTVREVTERIRRLQLQERYDKIASIVSGCLLQHRLKADGSFSIPYASIGLFHLFGIMPEEVIEDSSPLRARIHPDDVIRIHASLRDSARTLGPWQCEYRVNLPDGTRKWVFGHSVPEREADGSTLWHGFLTDVSDRKRNEARIYDLAYFDPLTRLPNRAMLIDALWEALSTNAGSRLCGALLLIDLDQFKNLNDSKGHHAGDRLLCEVADRLRAQTPGTDLVARAGGDEFVVLLQNLGDDAGAAAERADRCGREIGEAIARPFTLDGLPFHITASVGVALFQGDGVEVHDLLKRADLAMYEAKTAGRASLRFFAPEMQANLEERIALTAELKDALINGGLDLVYQPQVDRDGVCRGAEGLIRWDHPRRGRLAPVEFLAMAERSGLAGMIDELVVSLACATLRSWQESPLTRDLGLAINVSAHQLKRGFAAKVSTAFRDCAVDPGRLTLEMTEHVMPDDIGEAIEVMLMLKRLGARFALDDFGTGYSSLSYLKRLPINILKIDRSFVRDLQSEASDRVIVETIVNIARTLSLSVIAEGVETEWQQQLLHELGCHGFQGYLFGKPMPREEFEAYLGKARLPPAMREPSRDDAVFAG